jgi:L-ascorbate 6-phosphate lactonase
MNNTAINILSMQVPEGQMGVIFMGQAGLIIKTPKGELAGIDLYLSDCCERYHGFKRLMPKLISTTDIEFDYIITTHSHYDHFDVDAIPQLLAPQKTKLYCALDCKAECDRLGISEDKVVYLEKDKTVKAGSLTITPVACDHGELAPYAVGLYIECEGKSLYLAGDTCYREDYALEMAKRHIDIMFAPINGAYGNLNEVEGAKTFSIVKPGICVPCHYWNFAIHGGNPQLFLDEMKKYPELNVRLMTQGESVII